MYKKRAEESEKLSLIKKRGFAIRYGKKLHLSKSSPGSNKKEPTASIHCHHSSKVTGFPPI
jgi:hypothetical protein